MESKECPISKDVMEDFEAIDKKCHHIYEELLDGARKMIVKEDIKSFTNVWDAEYRTPLSPPTNSFHQILLPTYEPRTAGRIIIKEKKDE